MMFGSFDAGTGMEREVRRTFGAALNNAVAQLAYGLDGSYVLATQTRPRPALPRVHDMYALGRERRQSDRLPHDRAAA